MVIIIGQRTWGSARMCRSVFEALKCYFVEVCFSVGRNAELLSRVYHCSEVVLHVLLGYIIQLGFSSREALTRVPAAVSAFL